MFDSSYFIIKNYFVNDGSKNHLVCQLFFKTLGMPIGDGQAIIA